MFLPIDAFKDLDPGLKQLYHRSIAAYDSTWSSPCMSKSASIKVGVHRSDAWHLHKVFCLLEMSLYFRQKVSQCHSVYIVLMPFM